MTSHALILSSAVLSQSQSVYVATKLVSGSFQTCRCGKGYQV